METEVLVPHIGLPTHPLRRNITASIQVSSRYMISSQLRRINGVVHFFARVHGLIPLRPYTHAPLRPYTHAQR
jgi:hypothetical protein